MLAKVLSCAVVGLDGVLIEVEVDVGTGQPGMVLVGLPDAAVQESRERVRAAIRNSGGKFPHGRVTVNLAPADLKKAGPTYDLPIAIGILLGSNQIAGDLSDALIVGSYRWMESSGTPQASSAWSPGRRNEGWCAHSSRKAMRGKRPW